MTLHGQLGGEYGGTSGCNYTVLTAGQICGMCVIVGLQMGTYLFLIPCYKSVKQQANAVLYTNIFVRY